MEHLSQLEQKATTSVSRREHKGPRDDKVTKRESLGSFSMRDKSWRTGSPEMWVMEICRWGLLEAQSWFLYAYGRVRWGVLYICINWGLRVFSRWFPGSFSSLLSHIPGCLSKWFLSHWHQFWHLLLKTVFVEEFTLTLSQQQATDRTSLKYES